MRLMALLSYSRQKFVLLIDTAARCWWYCDVRSSGGRRCSALDPFRQKTVVVERLFSHLWGADEKTTSMHPSTGDLSTIVKAGQPDWLR
jgi:hypothetical protein